MKTKQLILSTMFAALFLAQLYFVSSLTISSATNTPSEVQPGQKFSAELRIENDLNEDIENVAVSLNLDPTISPVTGQVISQPPFAPYQSSNEVVINDINEDDKENANFDLMVFSDAASGTYNIPVQVSYTLSDGTRVKDENLGVVSVIVNAKPEIELSSEGSALIKGTNGKITIKIVNSGLGDSKFLSITLNQVSGIQLTSPSKVYIGNIDSNDFDTADFNVFVSQSASSSVSLPIQLTYTDSQNKQATQTITIPVKTYTAKEASQLGLVKSSSTFLIIFVLIVAVVIFFIYRGIRKRRRSKRNGQ